jgi:hypothetical protein
MSISSIWNDILGKRSRPSRVAVPPTFGSPRCSAQSKSLLGQWVGIVHKFNSTYLQALLLLVLARQMGAFLSTRPASPTTVHFASKPAVLTVKKTENPDQVEQLSLRELLESRCTSLFTGFSPLWWLPKCVLLHHILFMCPDFSLI